MYLLQCDGRSTCPEVFAGAFGGFLTSFTVCGVICTDGSGSDRGTGCTFVAPDGVCTFRLPPEASVYTAELAAILESLNAIEPRALMEFWCVRSR